MATERRVTGPVQLRPSTYPPILALPDELLLPILELSVAPSTIRYWPKHTYNFRSILSVGSTCKRFYSMAMALLYRKISFFPDCRSAQDHLVDARRLRGILKNIQNNPSLGSYCQIITFNLMYSERCPPQLEDDFATVEDLAQRLVNVKTLTIDGGFFPQNDERTWKLLGLALSSMSNVEHLSFSLNSRGPDRGPEVQRLMRVVQVPSLKSLSVRCPRIAKDDPSDCNSKEIAPAQFSELSIPKYEGSPKAIAILLNWPSKLSSVRICFASSRSQHVDWPTCRSMLLKHRQTLKRLQMEYSPRYERDTTCTMSDFTALESLSMSRCLLRRKLEPNDPISDLILSPPELRSFTWDFLKGHRWNDFGEIEYQWLRSLARLALTKGSKLSKVHIEFCPMDIETHKEAEYPWDKMGRLRTEFEPMGIVFTYSHPSMSRQDWKALSYSSDEEASDDVDDWGW